MTIKEFLLTKECEGYPSAWHAYVYNCEEHRGARCGITAEDLVDAFTWYDTDQGSTFWDGLWVEYEKLKNKLKQRNLVELFHTYDTTGMIVLCDERGYYPHFLDKKLIGGYYPEVARQNIIKDMPSRWLDLDTFELVEKDDE